MILYKYIRPQYIDKTLKEKRLKFSKPSQFNDPFEALPFVEDLFSKKIVEAIFNFYFNKKFFNLYIDCITNKDFKKSLLQMKKEREKGTFNFEKWYPVLRDESKSEDTSKFLKREWADKVGILSLSETENSVTMWSHYAEDHKGFVIGFDTDKLITNKSQILAKPLKIKYTNCRPQMFFVDSGNLKDRKIELFKNFYLTKSKEWEYEKEWRQINKLKMVDSSENNIFLYKLNIESINCIIIGCRMSYSNKIKIKELANQINIDIYQMEINKYLYRLDKIKI